MLGNLALVEDDAAARIETGGRIGGGPRTDRALELGGTLPQGDGVHVDDAIEAVVRLLHLHPARERAQVVAEMQVAGRLHAGKDAWGKRHAVSFALTRRVMTCRGGEGKNGSARPCRCRAPVTIPPPPAACA